MEIKIYYNSNTGKKPKTVNNVKEIKDRPDIGAMVFVQDVHDKGGDMLDALFHEFDVEKIKVKTEGE